eukprot:TRINITY_DN7554_c0_g1_i1.p1 TRINITY_DN7554_c0_g1~~TRINITY_DN7554_c0_g1_i1.p1  ORF type:complete len:123 (+),score=18.66 TRINITY_DN7554_c0_g1_i1:3-371(+)
MIASMRESCHTFKRMRAKDHKEAIVMEFSAPPPQRQTLSLSPTLTQIFIQDFVNRPVKIYQGNFLQVTFLTVPNQLTSGVYAVVEDEKGGLLKIGLYNFGPDYGRYLWLGQKVTIIDPYPYN